jgi:hypothetical protein
MRSVLVADWLLPASTFPSRPIKPESSRFRLPDPIGKLEKPREKEGAIRSRQSTQGCQIQSVIRKKSKDWPALARLLSHGVCLPPSESCGDRRKRGYSVCGHQVVWHRLIGAFLRCNHIAVPQVHGVNHWEGHFRV